MTVREAVIQAYIEVGRSPEEAELRAKFSEGCVPGAAGATGSPVRPGMEREFIEFLKQLLRSMDENRGVWEGMVRRELGKRTRWN